MSLRITDDFGTWILRGPIEVVDNGGFMGPCLRAEWREEGRHRETWNGAGDFRLDRITLLEPAEEQLELQEAA